MSFTEHYAVVCEAIDDKDRKETTARPFRLRWKFIYMSQSNVSPKEPKATECSQNLIARTRVRVKMTVSKTQYMAQHVSIIFMLNEKVFGQHPRNPRVLSQDQL